MSTTAFYVVGNICTTCAYTCIYMYTYVHASTCTWVCCVALPCLFDRACFFLPSFSHLSLKHVNIIILSSHQIKSLQGLSQFPVLGSLRLACNELEWVELPRLSHMTLLSLTLSGNPQLDSDPHCEPPPLSIPYPLSLSLTIAYPLSLSLSPSLTLSLCLSPSLTLSHSIAFLPSHSLCLSLFVDYILYYTDREHVVDILPNLWVLDERLITGIHVYVCVCIYVQSTCIDRLYCTTYRLTFYFVFVLNC